MIAVLGLGFVGLATALAFAEKGVSVTGYDIDKDRVGVLSAGKLPFHEPGLDTALTRHLGNKLRLTKSVADAIVDAEVVFICVGTPSTPNGEADLSYLLSAIDAILAATDKRNFKVLVIKSTVPPGTTAERIAPYLAERGWTIGENVGLANNPEFLREGKAWQDVTRPDRIVIGVEDVRSREILGILHAGFGAPTISVSWNTGEFIKYLSNTLIATMISFSNDASMIAEAVGGVDVKQAFQVLHQDRRWYGQPANMATYVYPGCGFGGYCLPKDTAALYAQSLLKGYNSPMLAATLAVNEKICDFVVKKIIRHASPGVLVGILGLAFKPDSDDVRETPAADIIRGLIDAGIRVVAYDPLAVDSFRSRYGETGGVMRAIDYTEDLEQIAAVANPLVILTGWSEFKSRKDLFVGKTMLDFRYIL